MKFLTWQNPEQLFVAQVLIKTLNYSVAEIRFYRNSYGFYWSSDVSKKPNCNEYLYMDKDFKMIDSCPRWRGMSVRPVREY